MNHQVPQRPDLASIRLPQRFDLVAASIFRKAYSDVLRDPAVNLIELDFEEVTYVDSTALGSLLLLRELIQKSGRSSIISNCSTDVMRILEMANFQRLFNVEVLANRCEFRNEDEVVRDGCRLTG